MVTRARFVISSALDEQDLLSKEKAPLELKPVSPTAKGPAKTFTGDVYVTPIYRGQGPSRMIISLVRFTPGARSAWHSHAVGQTLHVTDRRWAGADARRKGDPDAPRRHRLYPAR